MPRGRPKKNAIIRTNTIPSVASEKDRLYKMIREAVDAETMIAAQKDKLTQIKETIQEEFPITPKLMNKLIDFEFKQNYDIVSAEWNDFMNAHEELTNK